MPTRLCCIQNYVLSICLFTFGFPEERIDEGDGKGEGIRTVPLVEFPVLDEFGCDVAAIDDGAKGGGGGNGF